MDYGYQMFIADTAFWEESTGPSSRMLMMLYFHGDVTNLSLQAPVNHIHQIWLASLSLEQVSSRTSRRCWQRDYCVVFWFWIWKLWITFPKERHSRKQVNVFIFKTILFNPQNMFQSIHTSSSVAKNNNKNCKYSKFTCILKTLQY